VDAIPPPVRSIELHLGDSIHRALEKLYQDASNGQPPSCDELLAFYRQAWDEGYTPQLRIVRSGTTAPEYFEHGRRMLRNYYQRFYPFTQAATLGLEDEFLVPISASHEIRGVIDRIAKTEDGCLEIHDYKTSRRLPTSSQIDSDMQLALYELALRHRWPDAQRISLIWHYLAFDKEIRITKTAQQLDEVRQNALSLIEGIVASTSFPARVSALCDWCEYKEICPAIKNPRANAPTTV
jgi:putative RecB family exonuclease